MTKEGHSLNGPDCLSADSQQRKKHRRNGKEYEWEDGLAGCVGSKDYLCTENMKLPARIVVQQGWHSYINCILKAYYRAHAIQIDAWWDWVHGATAECSRGERDIGEECLLSVAVVPQPVCDQIFRVLDIQQASARAQLRHWTVSWLLGLFWLSLKTIGKWEIGAKIYLCEPILGRWEVQVIPVFLCVNLSSCSQQISKPVSHFGSSSVQYFIMKSSNIRNIEISQQKGIWSTTPSNEAKLTKALLENNLIILIFSVQGSGHFQVTV